MSRLQWADNFAGYLAEKTGAGGETKEIMAYALEVLGLNIVNLLGTVLLAWTLDVLPATLTIIAAAFLFRHTAGGGHSSSPWCCAVITIIVFPLLALLAHLIYQNIPWGSGILNILAILTGLVVVGLKAPVESPAAPILSVARRKKLKTLSLLVMVIITAIIIGLSFPGRGLNGEIGLALALATLWISFNLTNTAERFWSLVDYVSENYKRR